MALIDPSIARATQAAHRFDHVARPALLCDYAGGMISFGVIDHEYIAGVRVETANCGEASLEKVGTLAGTDYNSRSNWQLTESG